MLYSMTGFASLRESITYGDQALTVSFEVKALNARFAEVSCRTPHALSHLEPLLSRRAKKHLRRGSVFCTLTISPQSALQGSIQPALGVIEGYLQAFQSIQSNFGQKYGLENGRFSVRDVVDLPGAFETEPAVRDEEFEERILQLYDKTLDAVMQDRAQEGEALFADIRARLDYVDTLISRVEERAGRVLEEKKEQLLQAAREMVKESSQEASDNHLQHVYQQIEKLDVNEEVVRFKEHLKQLRAWIDGDAQEKGKKAVFFLQELFREINTVAAKCSDAELSNDAITIKVELEKAREQAQNII